MVSNLCSSSPFRHPRRSKFSRMGLRLVWDVAVESEGQNQRQNQHLMPSPKSSRVPGMAGDHARSTPSIPTEWPQGTQEKKCI